VTSFNVYAQKSYINVVASSLKDNYYLEVDLSGDIPSDMKSYYRRSDNTSIGDILNKLSARGFVVEFMSNYGSAGSVNYLLSKTSNSYNYVRSVHNEDVTEMARYNLQGIPVKANEKGVQIIVYSNYTTKTVIVQ
jgi:hypothetical protein